MLFGNWICYTNNREIMLLEEDISIAPFRRLIGSAIFSAHCSIVFIFTNLYKTHSCAPFVYDMSIIDVGAIGSPPPSRPLPSMMLACNAPAV